MVAAEEQLVEALHQSVLSAGALVVAGEDDAAAVGDAVTVVADGAEAGVVVTWIVEASGVAAGVT